jgi:hypothetical protein
MIRGRFWSELETSRAKFALQRGDLSELRALIVISSRNKECDPFRGRRSCVLLTAELAQAEDRLGLGAPGAPT